MKNARIAFVCYPHAAHVNPMLSIVSALARRGHHVTYVTSERFSPRVEAAGGQVLKCLPVINDENVVERICRIALQTLEDATSFYAHQIWSSMTCLVLPGGFWLRAGILRQYK